MFNLSSEDLGPRPFQATRSIFYGRWSRHEPQHYLDHEQQHRCRKQVAAQAYANNDVLTKSVYRGLRFHDRRAWQMSRLRETDFALFLWAEVFTVALMLLLLLEIRISRK